MRQLTRSSHEVRYFPPWLPGGGWKKHVPEYTKDLNAMCDIPYQFVKDCMVSPLLLLRSSYALIWTWSCRLRGRISPTSHPVTSKRN